MLPLPLISYTFALCDLSRGQGLSCLFPLTVHMLQGELEEAGAAGTHSAAPCVVQLLCSLTKGPSCRALAQLPF